MSGSSDKPRWRDGFWYNSKISDTILVVEGDNVEAKNLVALDFPDIDSGNPMTFKYGNFGPAKDEVSFSPFSTGCPMCSRTWVGLG